MSNKRQKIRYEPAIGERGEYTGTDGGVETRLANNNQTSTTTIVKKNLLDYYDACRSSL